MHAASWVYGLVKGATKLAASPTLLLLLWRAWGGARLFVVVPNTLRRRMFSRSSQVARDTRRATRSWLITDRLPRLDAELRGSCTQASGQPA